MIKKIPVEELCIGMYLDGIGKKWFDTPFIKHHFLIKKEKQIEKIKKTGLSHVLIDTERGIDVPEESVYIETENESYLEKEDLSTFKETSQVDFSDYSKEKEKFLQIDKLILLKGGVINFSLFTKEGMIIKPLVEFNDKDIEINDNILSSADELLISHKDILKYKNYLKELNPGADASQQRIKNIIVRESAKIIMREYFENPTSGNNFKECKIAVEGIIDSIISSKGVLSGLLTIDNLDYYIYTHSVNVIVLSLCIAKALGIDKEDELFSLGLGCILHDIGKSTISSEIINKPEERLTYMENTVLRQHVLEGHNLLKLFSGIPEDVFYPILEHHEKLSGNGYPHGLKGMTFIFQAGLLP